MRSVFLPVLLFCAVTAASTKQRILVATDIWSPTFTRTDGNGLYQLMLKKVYPQASIDSYDRSKTLVEK